jgi:hypothetical protein
MKAYDEPDWIEPQEEDYTISDARNGGYFVGVIGGKCAGQTVSTREEAEEMIRNHAGKNWRPNVWVISDHGNFILIEDFDWKD